MKKILLVVLVSGLVLGCATGPPARNPQFTESSLPRRCYIEGIKPINGDPGVSYWASCIDMVLNLYGKPLGKETRDKAITHEKIRSSIDLLSGVAGPNPYSPEVYYPTALGLHGFKHSTFYDQSPDGTKIKYFLAQGHPVINLQREKMSYVLLIGYDDEKEIFFVCGPKSEEPFEMPYRDFPRRQAIEWADTSKLIRRGEIIYPEK